MAQRPDIPPAAQVAEVNVASRQTGSAIQTDSRILHMHMINAANKICQKQMRCDRLPDQVARIKVQAKLRTICKLLIRLVRQFLRGKIVQTRIIVIAYTLADDMGCQHRTDQVVLLRWLSRRLYLRVNWKNVSKLGFSH